MTTKDVARKGVVGAGVVFLAVMVTAAVYPPAVGVSRGRDSAPAPVAADTSAAAAPAPAMASGPIAMRAVHLTGAQWATPAVHDAVLQMISTHQIDTVVLDIRDETGTVNYSSTVPLAKQVGDIHDYYDPKTVATQLHALGVRVVGRLVAFQDPTLAAWAWDNGHHDWVAQDSAGQPFHPAAAPTADVPNLASADVQNFAIDLAKEATAAGFDDVMFDYVQTPASTGVVLPGLGTTDAQDELAQFLGTARKAVDAVGGHVAAAVAGTSVLDPSTLGQNVAKLAANVDWLAPQIFPSTYADNAYDVTTPNSAPLTIVARALKDWNTALLGTNAVLVPWLQGAPTYDATQVAQEITGAGDAGINSWMLSSPDGTYQSIDLAPNSASATADAPGQLIYSSAKAGSYSVGTTDKTRAEQVALTDRPDTAANLRTTGVDVEPLPSAPPVAPPKPVVTTKPVTKPVTTKPVTTKKPTPPKTTTPPATPPKTTTPTPKPTPPATTPTTPPPATPKS
ncbi:MAG TPA: putative glycoside hydrolase [Sporichthyaceae bacterium]|jgi:hypothetical protein|nr:putative glycoside hydrolase [Sporichthyaceae bacterium]